MTSVGREVMLNDQQRKYIIRKLIGCRIRTSYYTECIKKKGNRTLACHCALITGTRSKLNRDFPNYFFF